MSGHSKWSQIKHKKALTDEKRAKQFTKLLMAVQTAAKIDPNPDFNPRLRAAIAKAKEENVPSDNIVRAINRAKDNPTEDILIEAYGPGGTAFVIKAATDNRNRTIAEVKRLLLNNNAKFAEQGSVMWGFTQNGEGEFIPKFKQPVAEEDNEKIEVLTEVLLDHPDVMEVYANIKK
ncbi:MAG: YebC/PmpR family DNA-binding transcriptional regulator [Parcubacteria group bacterium]